MHVSSAKPKMNRKLHILVKFDALDHSAMWFISILAKAASPVT